MSRTTLLNIRLIEEKYGSSIVVSLSIHAFIVLMLVGIPYILPKPHALQLGTGPGGGRGGESYTVGVVDELAGGAGMTKPSLVPQPPALPEKSAKEESKPAAIALPNTIESKKSLSSIDRSSKKSDAPLLNSKVIPTTPQPGVGGAGGGRTGGIGGGEGGGTGVSLGSGTGGFGDSLYAQAVENRISQNWTKPPVGPDVHYEVICSFYIGSNGVIYDVKLENSSGNPVIDDTIRRAILLSNPLVPPPPEYRGRPLQCKAHFTDR